ncbi:FUSC family protein [Jeongeupia naejangsanensis]|uniref:Integral membrane bound transporter domain-containing protein n=1 Tax=Jeongeupia naejangsanensis TaxID=613195 RepID=A0ABS2BRC8_9NEIS|nr:FUSC family protein [Jeongeupia naejangsanensis]MBM3117349.1 hypothetical protein [Jeongeupia naejangsanensis]
MLIDSFTPQLRAGDAAALAYRLSDGEAGTPRQWYWLEIAARLPASSAPPRRIVDLAARVGPMWSWPWLERCGLPGIALYGAAQAPVWQGARDSSTAAALYVAVISALLAGFGLLPATQTFAAWLLLLFGALYAAWRTPKDTPASDDTSPGPEECTGLTGLLLASGCVPARALALVADLHASPDTGWPALIDACPALRPTAPPRRQRAGLRVLAWIAGALPATALLALLPAPWGLVTSVLASTLWIGLLAGPRAALVTIGCTVLVYGLGTAVHLL